MATQAQLDQEALIRRQDELRPYRQFLSLVSGVTGDQSYNDMDSYGANPTGQFTSVGPYSSAVEGQPIVTYSPNNGTVSIAPVVLLIGLGLAAFVLLK
jgi:hypothetical protein